LGPYPTNSFAVPLQKDDFDLIFGDFDSEIEVGGRRRVLM